MATKAKRHLYSIQTATKLPRSLGTFKGCVLPYEFRNFQDQIENFEVRDDDVWITGFPRSGSTWMQEMLWLLGNDLDYEGAKMNLSFRFPVLEATAIMKERLTSSAKSILMPQVQNSVQEIGAIDGKRFIKTHLPWDLLPLQIRNGTKQAKIVNVIRNPKDVCVSFFHHFKLFPGHVHTLEEHFNGFVSDTLVYSPYWNNIQSYWTRRSLPNLLIITYEEMKKNLTTVMRKVANFMEKDLTNEQICRLEQHLSFEQMKKNKALNYEPVIDSLKKMQIYQEDPGHLMRKGVVGSYRDELDADMIQMLNIWIEQNTVDTGLYFNEHLLM